MDPFEDDKTVLTEGDADLDDAGAHASGAAPRAATVPYYGDPTTPRPAAPPVDVAPPSRPSQSKGISRPRLLTPARSMPSQRPSAPPAAAPVAPVRPTPIPPPAASPQTAAQLAGLASLSLDRPALPPATAPASAKSSKLPWLVLVLVVGGGAYYHITTVQALEARIATKAQAKASTDDHPADSHRPTGVLASGYIAAKEPIVLSANASGRLQALKVDDGDTITKGEIIAVMDDTQVRADLSLADARYRDAKRNATRMRMLANAQAATPADLEHAIGEVEVASAEMNVVQQRLNLTRIRSPINGTVLEVLAHPGEMLTVGPSSAAGIVRVADLTSLVAEVDVGEADVKNVFPGQRAEVTSDSLRGRQFPGVVREIAEQADRARGTITVKVEILRDDAGSAAGSAAPAGSGSSDGLPSTILKVGMAVQVSFTPRDAKAQ